MEETVYPINSKTRYKWLATARNLLLLFTTNSRFSSLMKNRIIFLFSIALILNSSVSSQQIDKELFKDYKPRSIGPAGMSGRVTAIAVVDSSPNLIYAGTASGGLWKSESGGTAWDPIFDDQLAASIGLAPAW